MASEKNFNEEPLTNYVSEALLAFIGKVFETKNPLDDLITISFGTECVKDFYLDFFDAKKDKGELKDYKFMPTYWSNFDKITFMPQAYVGGMYSQEENEDNVFQMNMVYGSYLIELTGDVKILMGFQSSNIHDRNIVYGEFVISEKSNIELVKNFLGDLHKYAQERSQYKNRCIRFTRDQHGNLTKNFIKRTNMTMEDIIIDAKIKNKVEQYLFDYLNKIDIYKKYGVSSNIGVFLTGAPGNGKTTLCKILRDVYRKHTFIWAMALAVRSADDVNYIYTEAREHAPCIVLWEDVGPYVRSRNSGDIARGNEQILDEFLQQLCGPFDNSGVITIMTSNMGLEEIDEAILRPGRVGYHIEFPKPSDDAVIKYINKLLKEIRHGIEDKDLDMLKKKDLSFVKIYEILDASKKFAIDDESFVGEELFITSKHFNEAIDFVMNMGERVTTERAGFRRTFNEGPSMGATSDCGEYPTTLLPRPLI